MAVIPYETLLSEFRGGKHRCDIEGLLGVHEGQMDAKGAKSDYILQIQCPHTTVKSHNLHGDQHAGVLVPAQQRIFPTPRLRVFDVRPSVHKVFVAHDLG